MNKNLIILGIVVSFALFVGSRAFLSMQNTSIFPSEQTTTISQPPETSSDTVFVTPATYAVERLRAGGSSYADPKGVFSFLYPNDYTLDKTDSQHIRIYKRGATQQGQTEIYDGVLIVVESLALRGQSLSEFVDARIKEASKDGTSELLLPKKAITLNNATGFTYQTRGFGSAIHLILQKTTDSDYGISITYSVNDPENKNYQEEVDATLSTLELFK